MGPGDHGDLEGGRCVIDHHDLIKGQQRHDLPSDD
jgi:hypothetical protein